MLRRDKATGLIDRHEAVPLDNDSMVSEHRCTKNGGDLLRAELRDTPSPARRVPTVEHDVKDQVGASGSEEALW